MELPETKHEVISPLAGLSAAELQTIYGNTKDEEDPSSPRALPALHPPSPPPPSAVTCSPLSAIMFVSALGMGSGITVLNKVTFQTNATGLSGLKRHYEKPFMATFVMFAAMTTVLPLHWVVSCWEAKQYRTKTEREKHEMPPTKAKAGAGTAEGPRSDYQQDQHAHHEQQDEPPIPRRRRLTKNDVLALGVPALLDMCTVVCFWIGLTHISAHVFSPDGKEWHFLSPTVEPYTHTVEYSDGNSFTFVTLERPNIHFDSTGQMTHINLAADLTTKDAGCNMDLVGRKRSCAECKFYNHCGTTIIALDV